ncbi:MAG TPA: amidohydrolase family protein [Rhodothermales bacterium]|nr:amidohydrolase family protein [Rhodothermales bacterium]
MIYDVHAHCVPPKLLDWIEQSGSRIGISVEASERGVRFRFEANTTSFMHTHLIDMERRISAMDRMGIDIQLLAGWIDIVGYELPPASGLTYSQIHNNLMAEEASLHGDRLMPMATVPLQDPQAASVELVRAIKELGMVGVQISTMAGELWLDQLELDPFWEAAEDLNTLVLIHPGFEIKRLPLNRYFMDNIVGRPAQTTIALTGLILSGKLERFPGLKLCAVHGGGFIPYQIGRIQRGFETNTEDVGKSLKSSPRESYDRLYFDTIVHDPAALRFLLDSVGAHRVLLGTDYPFEMGDRDPTALLELVPGLTPQERSLVQSGNIVRLLG